MNTKVDALPVAIPAAEDLVVLYDKQGAAYIASKVTAGDYAKALVALAGLRYDIAQNLTPFQQRQAAENLGVGPVYAHFAHTTANIGVMAFGRSTDGFTITAIGDTDPFTAEGVLNFDHPRDPIGFFYKPTKEFIAIYTHSGVTAQATGTLTLSGNAVADQTVTIGNKTYTWKASVTTTANQVKIGATASDSLDNLIAAITGGAGSGSLYGSATTVHTQVTAAAGAGDTMTVTALEGGDIGNSYATTETMSAGSFGAATLTGGVNNYAKTLGVCKTRDGNKWTYVGEIPITGSAMDGDVRAFCWSGHVFQEDDGSIYATLSILPGASTMNLVIGWIKFNSPGTNWLDVTAFTPMTTNNPNFATFIAGSVQNNDMWVGKYNGVYHYFFDSGANGAHDIYRMTSTVLFQNMTSPVSTGLRALTGLDSEGQYLARNYRDDGWLFFSQQIFGPVQVSFAADIAGPWSVPVPVRWPGTYPIGNGSVVRLTDPDAINILNATPETRQFIDTNYVNSTIRFQQKSGTFTSYFVAPTKEGNGAYMGKTGATVNGSPTVTIAVAGLAVGMYVQGPGIPAMTYILAVGSTTITLTQNATATSGAAGLTFGDVMFYQRSFTNGTITHYVTGDIYTGGVWIQGANNAIYIQTTTGLPRLWMERYGTGVAYQYIILGSDMYLTGGSNAGGYVGWKLGADGVLTLGPGSGDSIKKATVVGVAGLKFPTVTTDVESGAWWDNAGTLTKKP